MLRRWPLSVGIFPTKRARPFIETVFPSLTCWISCFCACEKSSCTWSGTVPAHSMSFLRAAIACSFGSVLGRYSEISSLSFASIPASRAILLRSLCCLTELEVPSWQEEKRVVFDKSAPYPIAIVAEFIGTDEPFRFYSVNKLISSFLLFAVSITLNNSRLFGAHQA